MDSCNLRFGRVQGSNPEGRERLQENVLKVSSCIIEVQFWDDSWLFLCDVQFGWHIDLIRKYVSSNRNTVNKYSLQV